MEIDFDNTLFHFIRNPYDIRLNRILDHGAILSRKKQRAIFGENFNDFRKLNWNDDDYVSVASSANKAEEINSMESFVMYGSRCVGVMLDKNCIEIGTRNEFHQKLGGEIQIKDSIPKKYFTGICVPQTNCAEQVKQDITNVLKMKNLALPVFTLKIEEWIKSQLA